MKRRRFIVTAIGAAAIGVGLQRKGAQKNMDEVAAQEEHQLLATANERIERHRKGDVTVVVRTAQGKPLPHAALQLVQTRHAFLFGCNIFRWGRIANPEREALYRERFAAIFNYATLPFYWAFYERERGKPIYDYTERVVEWCQQHGIVCKGHPLVWDHPASSPSWLPDDFAEIERLSTARVREIVRRFAGQIDLWDVVNEPTHTQFKPSGEFATKMRAWAHQLGPVAYTRLHLQIARQANPKATLLVNDYNTSEAYLRILQQLRDEGGRWLFDVVGIQSHMHGGVWSPQRTWQICERFAQLGLPLHFTETTIVSGPSIDRQRWGETTPDGEERQAEGTERFYTLLFSHPAVQAITWWDFSDDGAWMDAPAGWLRKDMSPKPVYERMMALIKGAWWTKASGVTDAHGEWRTRAVFGDYTLTVRAPDGRTVTYPLTVRQGADNRFEVRLTA
ncbi:Anti-sigma-I factor RsgI6 [bacterium HR17]|uniref:Beta-xylanase n=1 Tax=Candidatus Fervidibacter japonicus TaxID=2035412 RepID=A0A2H5XEA4_9BACT|nr:Anti-sigma-I factor RsgI6 [bacterium HR17]